MKFKKAIALFITLALMAGLFVIPFDRTRAASSEFTPKDVTGYTVGTTVTRDFTRSDEKCFTYWYKVSIPYSGLYESKMNVVYKKNRFNGKKVKIFDTAGNEMSYIHQSEGEASEVLLLLKGEYYFYISNSSGDYSDGTCAYSLTRIEPQTFTQDFEETYTDAATRNDSLATASKIHEGTFRGIVSNEAFGNNTTDYYRLNTTANAVIGFLQSKYQGSSSYARARILDEAGKEVDTFGSSSEYKEITVKPGVWYIHVSGTGIRKLVTYTLTVKGSGVVDETHKHTMEPHEAVAATCETAGSKAYWYCTGCEKYFSDALGNKEVAASSLTVKALGHSWGEWKEIMAPTYTEYGKKERVCLRDPSHVQTANIAKLKYVTKITAASSVTVAPKATKKLSVTVAPSGAYNKAVSYTSANKAIATVSSKGVITGVKAGKTTITIKAKDGSGITAKVTVNVSAPEVAYKVYTQKIGWMDYQRHGSYAGTKGLGYRVEGIKVKPENANGGVSYRTYVQKKRWQPWVSNGQYSGTKGESLRVEAFQMNLTGEVAKDYSIYYRAYVQRFGWLGWTKDGDMAGTGMLSLRLEGLQVKICKKGDPNAPSLKGWSFCFDY